MRNGKPLCGRDDPQRPFLFTYQYLYINGMPSQVECFSIRFGKPIRPHARFLAQMHGGAFLTDARIPYRKRRSVTVRSVGIAIGGEIGPVQPHSPCQIVMPANERTPAFRKASKGEPQIGRVEGSGIIPRHSDIEMIVVWRGSTACGPFADQREIAELADMHRLPIFSRSDELIGPSMSMLLALQPSTIRSS